MLDRAEGLLRPGAKNRWNTSGSTWIVRQWQNIASFQWYLNMRRNIRIHGLPCEGSIWDTFEHWQLYWRHWLHIKPDLVSCSQHINQEADPSIASILLHPWPLISSWPTVSPRVWAGICMMCTNIWDVQFPDDENRDCSQNLT